MIIEFQLILVSYVTDVMGGIESLSPRLGKTIQGEVSMRRVRLEEFTGNITEMERGSG